MELNGVWMWLVSQRPLKVNSIRSIFSKWACRVKTPPQPGFPLVPMLSLWSLLTPSPFVLDVVFAVLHAVSAAGSHRAEQHGAKWHAGTPPHRPEHLPRAWMHHRLRRQTGRAYVPRQMVTPALPLFSILEWKVGEMVVWGWNSQSFMFNAAIYMFDRQEGSR